ncbi:2-keto-4-pentenoate hydratase [Tardiphaga sp. 862_B3_N1_1]|uniref:2-keto-4-pentenoate hydratase n=1 Tax=Tardiphaga sp. 862_B3_N1_1 TaxID=3240763 RepID=UPI003F8BFB29
MMVARTILSQRLREFAQRQWRDYQAAMPGSAFADPELSLTLEEAYAVQVEVARLRCADGDAVAGYQVGCIGPGVVSQFGMSGPIHARVFRSEVHVSGSNLRHGAYANLAIEGEMALRIGENNLIVAAFPVIELHNFVFKAPVRTLAELTANNGINAGVVVSQDLQTTPLDYWESSKTLSISVNGATIDSGALWAMTGGPAEVLDWLRSDLVRFGGALKPGDLVLAGTPLGLHPVKPNDQVAICVDGQRLVECRIS